MSREREVVAYLRADSELGTLLPGGIYSYSELSVAGLTDARQTPDVWIGGEFNASALVREGAAQPTGELQSTQSGLTSMSQRVAIWVYAKTADEILAAMKRIYTLMMPKRLPASFSARPAGGGTGIDQAPEYPPGIKTHHEDYRIVFIRRP